MENEFAFYFAITLYIISVSVFSYGVYKCGQLKDEINKEIEESKRKYE